MEAPQANHWTYQSEWMSDVFIFSYSLGTELTDSWEFFIEVEQEFIKLLSCLEMYIFSKHTPDYTT